MNSKQNRRARRCLQLLGQVLPRGKRIFILPHDYPDPDALASAAAMHLLIAKYFGLHSQIVFSGQVSRAENKELLRHLRFRWHRLENIRAPRRAAACVFVDCTPWSRNVTQPAAARPVAVLDHHKHISIKRRKGVFIDVRDSTGATTTLTYEYLKAANVPIPRWLASIMAYAIASETLDLSRDSDEADLRAYVELAAQADLKIIGRIRHAPLPRAYFTRLKEGLANARKIGFLAWTHLQSIEQPEIVAEIADLLLRMDGIRWSFCMAHLNGGLHISLRSSQRGVACGRLLRSVIGRGGSAGGHDRMAAGYLDLGDANYRERQAKRKQFQAALIKRITRRQMRKAGDADMIVQPLLEPSVARARRSNKPR